jgi:hypothetical protein
MLTFGEDGPVPIYRLEGWFSSPEAALKAGNREIAERGAPDDLGFQIHDGNGNILQEFHRGEANLNRS